MKKHSIGKLISSALILALVFSCVNMVSLPVHAASSGTCGANLTWTLDDEGTLTISGTGVMANYSTKYQNDNRVSTAPWGSSVKQVVIESGVTSIGQYAFYNCMSLTSVTIPDSVTSIGSCAFEDCTRLTSVTIGSGVTSIESYAFYRCTGLTSITIPDSVTSIESYAFSGCTGLTSITIPDSVTSIGSDAFYGCSIKKLIIAEGSETVTSTMVVCKSTLQEVEIPDSVTSIGSDAFYNCMSLTSVTIPDSVTSIGSCAFEDCTRLTSVTIPDSVTSIGSWAFSGCSGLTSITIPDSVTSIESYAFSGCSGLTSVTVGHGVTSIADNAFSGCTSLENVSLPCTLLNRTSLQGSYTLVWCHAYELLIPISEPTCESEGSALYHCPVCGALDVQTTDALGHDYQLAEVVAPTCEEQGYTLYVCTHDASHTYKDDYTDALGHNYQLSVIVDPTCEEQGYTLYVCTHDASHTYKTDFTDALGHDYEDTVIDPTYYSEGYTLHVCKHDPSHRYTDSIVPPVDNPTAPVFYSESVSGVAARFAYVPIYLKNNPGVIAAQVRVSYDPAVFTLVEVLDMKLLGETNFPENLSRNPYVLSWENDLLTSDLALNGTAAILVFAVAADAPDGEHTITLESVSANTWNASLDEVHILTENATVTVRHVVFGNISGDGEVNGKDRILLSRCLAGWDMSGYELDLDAADINGDGRVNAKDRMILARYLAGWGGEYDQYFN